MAMVETGQRLALSDNFRHDGDHLERTLEIGDESYASTDPAGFTDR